MTEDDFKRLHECDFKVDERILELESKWVTYYKESRNCSNVYAAHLRRELKRWCRFHYTAKEISAAKKLAAYTVGD